MVGRGLDRWRRDWHRWVAFSADRRILTTLVLLIGFTFFGPVASFLLPSAKNPLADSSPTISLVSALLSGTFFLFSIVVTVNTLFVSQQQHPLAQQFGRVQSVVEYRRQLEDVVDTEHVPAEPEALLRLLSGSILERAQRLEDELGAADFELREDLDGYVETLAEETGEMNRGLEDAEDTLDVVLATIDYDHDRQIHDLRAIRVAHGDELDDGTAERIEEMLRLLQYAATAREYFKTLYTRRDLANLSRDLVLTAVPTAAIVAAFMHFLTDLPDSNLLVVAVEAVAFAPFVLVAAYVLRVTLVNSAQRAAGQFVVGDDGGDIEGIPDGD
ncbi:hypothetical protein J2752_001538 [Halarchaeum rubridurum]|uniref:Uncharacterized protein n=1 Tax=Halarchaeum rubridurum TaxID=489911 RepID=A0A8T4GLV8_9EURY|nr:hypothetical protein [Halarchaeum rubridurum]MBP1954626.1 hypothetical protein [Halarchaeum rubridurum]